MAPLGAFALLPILPAVLGATYSSSKTYQGDDFLSEFDWFNAADPTNGFVQYVSQGDMFNKLAYTKGSQFHMGVDTTQVVPDTGRASVRATSKLTFQPGTLMVLDLDHMPGSACGSWPAFWTVGTPIDGWPDVGEIDIIEGVNERSYNAMTLHTGPGCKINNSNVEKNDCNAETGHTGCSIETNDMTTYGDGFNNQSGGFYAMEWTNNVINMWHFPASSPPAIDGETVDPTTWTKPLSSFDISTPGCQGAFKPQTIVFDTTFCGDWAGRADTWDTSECAKDANKQYQTCKAFVQNNGNAFEQSFWTVNSLKVFTGNANGGAYASGSSPAPSSANAPVASSQGSAPPATTYANAQPTGNTAPAAAPSSATAPAAPPAPAPSATSAVAPAPASSGHNWGGRNRGGRNWRNPPSKDVITSEELSPGGNVGQVDGNAPDSVTPIVRPQDGPIVQAASFNSKRAVPFVDSDGAVRIEKRAAPFVGSGGRVQIEEHDESDAETAERHLQNHRRHARRALR